MKNSEIEKTLGPLFVPVSDNYNEIVVPMTFHVYADLNTVERGADGKVMKANTLFSAKYDPKHFKDVDWKGVVGDAVILDSINRYISRIGVVGRLFWATMSVQEPGSFEFKMKPFMVDEFFPELGAHHDATQRRERRSTPRPEFTGTPLLKVV